MKIKELTCKEIVNIINKNSDILKKYGVKKLELFGSYVKGEQKNDSDIDFLVEFNIPNFENFMDLVFFLEDLFGKKVELITKGSMSPYIEPYVEKELVWSET
jgi:predicted nucleotidyltransferase